MDEEKDGQYEDDEEFDLSAAAVAAGIQDLIDEDQFQNVWADLDQEVTTRSYRAAGLLTSNEGFVLSIGREVYQVTVVKVR